VVVMVGVVVLGVTVGVFGGGAVGGGGFTFDGGGGGGVTVGVGGCGVVFKIPRLLLYPFQ